MPLLPPVAAQLAQSGAIAALLGGNLFGRIAMHPALRDVSDEAQRGKVLNHAWRRYGTVNSLALAGLVGGWASDRGEQAGELVLAKDVAVAAVVLTGLASAAGGVTFAHQADDGAVPLHSGSTPAARTPPRAARLKRAVNVLGSLNLAAEAALLGIDVLLSDAGGRRARKR